MKIYTPSMRDDYYYSCDCCEIADGRPTLVWKNLPNRTGYFAICFQCLEKLYKQYTPIPEEISIEVTRMVIPEELRNKVFNRDGNKCVQCGSPYNLQLDHIIPFSKGGQTIETNLQTLCKACNIAKGAKYAKTN